MIFVFCFLFFYVFFFFQAEDGIRDLVRSRGLGDVYKRQSVARATARLEAMVVLPMPPLAPKTVMMVPWATGSALSLIHI